MPNGHVLKKEIELHAKNMIVVLGSMVNLIGGTYMTIKRSLTMLPSQLGFGSFTFSLVYFASLQTCNEIL